MNPWRAASLLLGFGATAFAGSLSAQARAHKLNGELRGSTRQDVDAFRVSSEGHVLFAHTELPPNRDRALLVAPVDGSAAPTRLADSVGAFELTPDAGRVVFTGPARSLYARGILGASPAEVVGQFGPGEVDQIVVTADGQRAVYLEVEIDYQTLDSYERLFSADLDGSGWRRIDGGAFDSSVRLFRVSPDGSQVVYVAGQLTGGIHVVPTDGSQPAQLLATGSTAFLALASDGQHVLFADHASTNRGLRSVPTSGGTPVRLNPGTSLLDDVGWGPASRPLVVGGAVYFLGQDPLDGTSHLYRAPVDGGGPALRLDAPFTAFPGAGVHAFRPLAGDTHIVYAATVSAGVGDKLFRVPTHGTQVASELSGSFVSGGGVARDFERNGFVPSPDGARIAFVADRVTDEVFEAWSVPSDGSAAPVRLGPAFPASADVEAELVFTPDGQAVLMRLRGSARTELHVAASATAGVSARLNDDLVLGGEVLDVVLGPGGQRAFYRADRERDEAFELFGVRLATPGAPVRLNEPLGYETSGEVSDFLLSPDGKHVGYIAQLLHDSVAGLHARELQALGRERDLSRSLHTVAGVLGFSVDGRAVYATNRLHSAALDGSAPPVALTSPGAFPFGLSPDGRWLVFRGAASSLRSARTDGSSGEVPLATFGLLGGDARPVPDNLRVVFTSGDVGQSVDLYATRLDGSQAPLRISAPLGSGRGVASGSLRFSPDAGSVLYCADDTVDDRFELFLASVNGSFPAYRLSAPLVPNGSVRTDGVFFTPDGTRVVYAADQDVLGQVDLYAVPSDGSSAPVRLSLFGVNGEVSWSLTQLTNTHAYFAAGLVSGSPGRIFRAPLDASAPPQRLTNLAVLDLALTKGGERVVFRSAGSRPLLYSMLADGSGEVLLSTGLASDEGVPSYRLRPEGDGVVYKRETLAQRRQGLFLVAADGGTSPRLLTPGLVEDRVVREYAVAPDGSRVLYLADEELQGHPELYQSFLEPAHRAR